MAKGPKRRAPGAEHQDPGSAASAPPAPGCGSAWTAARAPSLDDLHALAEAALGAMPEPFRATAQTLLIRTAEFPTEDQLTELGIVEPFDLTGLYEGHALTEGEGAWAETPPTVWLFRRPILDEWAERGDVALGHLVAHVLIHEIGHHFGLSDDDIAAIEDWRL